MKKKIALYLNIFVILLTLIFIVYLLFNENVNYSLLLAMILIMFSQFIMIVRRK